MDKQELRELVEKLHAEIQNAHSVNEKGLELVLYLESDIRDLLNRSDHSSQGHRLFPLQVGRTRLCCRGHGYR